MELEAVTEDQVWEARAKFKARCQFCFKIFPKARGCSAHTNSCARKKDRVLEISPSTHRILRPFGSPWARFYIIATLDCSRPPLAWPESRLEGDLAPSMIDQFWATYPGTQGNPRENETFRHEKDRYRCEFCGIPEPHNFCDPTLERDYEPPLLTPHSSTHASHVNRCKCRPGLRGKLSTSARAVFDFHLERRASHLPRLVARCGPIANAASEIALGDGFPATASPLAAVEHRINIAQGSFNSLGALWFVHTSNSQRSKCGWIFETSKGGNKGKKSPSDASRSPLAPRWLRLRPGQDQGALLQATSRQ